MRFVVQNRGLFVILLNETALELLLFFKTFCNFHASNIPNGTNDGMGPVQLLRFLVQVKPILTSELERSA